MHNKLGTGKHLKMATRKWSCIAYLLFLSWEASSVHSRVISGKHEVVDQAEQWGLGGQIAGGLGGIGGAFNFGPGFGIGGSIGGGIGSVGTGSDQGGGCGGGGGGRSNCGGQEGGPGFVNPGVPGFGIGGGMGGQLGSATSGLYCRPMNCPDADCRGVIIYFEQDQQYLDETKVHKNNLKVDQVDMDGGKGQGQNGNFDSEEQVKDAMAPESD